MCGVSRTGAWTGLFDTKANLGGPKGKIGKIGKIINDWEQRSCMKGDWEYETDKALK